MPLTDQLVRLAAGKLYAVPTPQEMSGNGKKADTRMLSEMGIISLSLSMIRISTLDQSIVMQFGALVTVGCIIYA